MSREFTFAANSAFASKMTCTSPKTARNCSRRRRNRWKIRLGKPRYGLWSTEPFRAVPEFGPGRQQVVAQVDVGMVAALFVDHAVRLRVVRNDFATLEIFFQKILVEPNRN